VDIFITIDELLQNIQGCFSPMQAMLPEGFFSQINYVSGQLTTDKYVNPIH